MTVDCFSAQSYEKIESKTKKLFLFLPRWSELAIFDGKITEKGEIIEQMAQFRRGGENTGGRWSEAKPLLRDGGNIRPEGPTEYREGCNVVPPFPKARQNFCHPVGVLIPLATLAGVSLRSTACL